MHVVVLVLAAAVVPSAFIARARRRTWEGCSIEYYEERLVVEWRPPWVREGPLERGAHSSPRSRPRFPRAGRTTKPRQNY